MVKLFHLVILWVLFGMGQTVFVPELLAPYTPLCGIQLWFMLGTHLQPIP